MHYMLFFLICFCFHPFSPILNGATCSTNSNRDKQTFSRQEQECARFVFSVLTDWLAVFFFNSHRPSLLLKQLLLIRVQSEALKRMAGRWRGFAGINDTNSFSPPPLSPSLFLLPLT